MKIPTGMAMPKRFDLIIGLNLVLTLIALIYAVFNFLGADASQQMPALIVAVLLFMVAAMTAGQWAYLKVFLIRPLRALERGGDIILSTHAAHDIEIGPTHELGSLPANLQTLGHKLAESKREVARALKTGAQQVTQQKDYLEQVIHGLDEGVLVCDSQGRILLYNPSAVRILKCPEHVGLGRSAYELIPRASVEHTLELIESRRADDSNAPTTSDFVCTVLRKEHMLHCRVGLMSGSRDGGGFVMTFSDVTSRQGALRKRNELLRQTIENLRSPLASLRAAAENLTHYDDIETDMRHAFQQVIVDESGQISAQIDALAEESRKLLGGEFVTMDIRSPDLIKQVRKRVATDAQLELTQTGLPLWLRVDSQAMVRLLEFYIRRIHETTGAGAFDLEADHRDHKVFLDLAWEGEPLSHTQLKSWEEETLPDVVGFPQVSAVLRQHASVVWSQRHPRVEGRAILRIPIPGAGRQWEVSSEIIPARPISYDFDLAEMAGDDAQIRLRPLRELNFVVFDTETTGLNPDQGDEVISIGAVRVVNQRILSDETFDQLVNPGRPIPKQSIKFHGITDEMVKDAPSLDTVLPQFRDFVSDSVLVAHNAWFDMKFLKRREAQTGIRLRNPVLDTLILSVGIHGHEVEQSLDAIAGRLGIEIFDRHSALADSLATAEVLLRLIDLAETKGIRTLQDAMNAYK
ncbi:exonuclease domain-containing protein [Granulosicoccaceae sp. 1_MG-2023]|nr:exonuclease domain-containing protein [Granulosicoccaceae sp. 1_MG-2023]